MSEVINFDPSGLADGNLSALAEWEKHKTDGPEIVISGGVLKNGTPNSEATAQHTATHNANHYAEIQMGPGIRDGNRAGLIVAGQAPDTTQDFYMTHITFSSETGGMARFAKKIGGVYTSVFGNIAVSNVYDDSVYRLVRAGDSIYAFLDGNQIANGVNGTAGELPGGQPGILLEDGSTIDIAKFVSGNVLSTTNTVSRSGVSEFPDQTSETNTQSSVPMLDGLGNPMFSSSGTITRYRATGLPPGISINSSTGTMSGTHTDGSEGVYGVKIWAEDDQGWLQGTGFDWTITTGTVPSDTTTPTFTSAPAVTATTDSGHTIGATLDEVGTVYGVRLANGATAPTSAQVKAGQDSTGTAAPEAKSSAAANSVSLVFSTGSASTTYDYYIVAEDDEGTPNLQASPTLVEGTTAATQVPGISAVTVQKNGVAVQASDWEINITLVSGGTEVYSGNSITSDSSGVIAAINTTGGSVGDSVRVEGYSAAKNYGFIFTQTLEDNA